MIRKNARTLWIIGLLMTGIVACIKPNIGGEGQSCSKYNACLSNLTCEHGICVYGHDTIQGKDIFDAKDFGNNALDTDLTGWEILDVIKDTPEVCVPKTCDDIGKVCGKDYDNGCGGTLDCGQCKTAYSCNENGLCVRTNSNNINWVVLPGGTFRMGCSEGDSACENDERPAHEVKVKSFAIMTTEVTEKMYTDKIGNDPSSAKSGDDYPVENVTWEQADIFCTRIGARLPTEAEWEYAARGRTTTTFYCGNDSACLKDIAWFRANSPTRKNEVGLKPANAYGLYDMLGNVWEWVQDSYHKSYIGAPDNSEAWLNTKVDDKIARGGGFASDAEKLRISDRYQLVKSFTNGHFGFRCARDY